MIWIDPAISHLGNRNTVEGYSITRPPLFDAISFDFWKIRMMTFIQAIEFRMWLMVETGYSPPTYLVDGIRTLKPANNWTVEEREYAQLNVKVLNGFFCALKSEDYMRVSTYSTGKEIWDRSFLVT